MLCAANGTMYCKASVYREGMDERSPSCDLRARLGHDGLPQALGRRGRGEDEAAVRVSGDDGVGIGVAPSFVQSPSEFSQQQHTSTSPARKETLVGQAACSVRGVGMGGRYHSLEDHKTHTTAARGGRWGVSATRGVKTMGPMYPRNRGNSRNFPVSHTRWVGTSQVGRHMIRKTKRVFVAMPTHHHSNQGAASRNECRF